MAAGFRLRRRQARLCRLPGGIVQGEMPPIFVLGPNGEPQIVNSRIHQNILIVDRLFGAAELRLGSGNRQQTVRIVRTNPTQAAASASDRMSEQYRPAPCACARTAARHPLVPQDAGQRRRGRALGIGGALIYALQTRDAGRAAKNSIRPTTAHGGRPGRPAARLHRPVLGPPLPATSAARSSTRRTGPACRAARQRRPPSIPRKNAGSPRKKPRA
jgi:hypothetical protein